MDPQTADSVAYVLMTALHHVSMLDRERTQATEVANALFKQLGYGHGCDSHGERKEWPPAAPTVQEWNDRRDNAKKETGNV
jgi:predicted metal-binding protein